MRKRRLAFMLTLMLAMTLASVATAGTALADGPGDGFGPWQWGWGGMWVIIPVIMIPTMLVFMYLMFKMFVREGGRPPWQGSGSDYREPEEHRSARRSENALEVLNRRYASGVITKAEFDEMKQDLA